MDTGQAFQNDDPHLRIVDNFDATSIGHRYVFGPEVQLNFSQINITESLAILEPGTWSLFKQGRVFSNIHFYGRLVMAPHSKGSLLILNGNNTVFQAIVQHISINVGPKANLAFFSQRNLGYSLIHCCKINN